MTDAEQTKPKERPILMQADMVRAVLSGSKTQTRRIIKPQPQPGSYSDGIGLSNANGRAWVVFKTHTMPKPTNNSAECPYGRVGDILWVRETFAYFNTGYYDRPEMGVFFRADGERDDCIRGRWRSSIHMPRDVSRLTLEITDIRVEQVQDITEEDAYAEGSHEWLNSHAGRAYDNAADAACRWTKRLNPNAGVCSHRGEFAALWSSINGEKPGASWADNCWVWAISFRRVEA